jgi:hypothetical protein
VCTSLFAGLVDLMVLFTVFLPLCAALTCLGVRFVIRNKIDVNPNYVPPKSIKEKKDDSMNDHKAWDN